MDETEALLSVAVARSASAWLRDPRSTDVYRRLVDAVTTYDMYRDPALPGLGAEPGLEELADALADDAPPHALGDLLAELPDALRRRAVHDL